MKAKALGVTKEFKPVSIEITFESQLELDNFGKAFNNGLIATAFSRIGVNCAIWKAVEEIGGNVHETKEVLKIFKEAINER